MLNAFRHQRFNTGGEPREITISFRAQRLSASEIQHILGNVFMMAEGMCSTPFGIRDSTPVYTILTCSQFYQVLNAFRHQRFNTNFSKNEVDVNWMCSTPFGIRDSTLTLAWNCDSTALRCSTPFGIRDSTQQT